jgi:fatty-acyl-CoA synthase
MASSEFWISLAPFSGTELFPRLRSELTNVDCLEHLVLVSLADRIQGPAQAAARKAQEPEAERVCDPTGIAN